MLAVKFSSPKELIKMVGLNEINRKTCTGKVKLLNQIKTINKMKISNRIPSTILFLYN